MKIVTRTRKLVTAALHDLFDRLENPERSARQSLRELADAIETATLAVARSIAAERILIRRRDEQRRQIAFDEQRAAESVRGGDEAAARIALGRKFEFVRAAARLDEQISSASAVNQGLRDQLEAMRERYRGAEDDLAAQIARHRVASAARQFAAVSRNAIGSNAALGELQGVLESVERSTLEVEVQAELDRVGTLDAEIHHHREQFVREELERLRK